MRPLTVTASDRLRQRPTVDFLLHHLGRFPTTNRKARVAPARSSTASSDRPTRVGGEGDFVGVILGIILAALGERLKNEWAFNHMVSTRGTVDLNCTPGPSISNRA